MSVFRVTLFFESNESGFTESYYREAASHEAAVEAAAGAFLTARVRMNGSNVICQAIRATNPDPPRDSLLFTINAANPNNPRGDYPGMGVQVRLAAGPLYRREQIFRGTPDEWLAYDEITNRFSMTPAWRTAFAAFKSELINKGWSLRVFDRDTNPAVKIKNVTRDSNVTAIVSTVGVHGLAVGDFVHLSGVTGRVDAISKILRIPTGRFQVMTTGATDIFSIGAKLPVNYLYDHGGESRKEIFKLVTIENTYPREPRTRRPGRLFFVPRGRR